MPRSYSERDVVERYVDLQAVLVGASPSLRSLARSLSLSAPAVYRYFGSIERLQKAALPSIADRLIKDAHRTEGASPRLVGLVQIQPGLMWAVSRIGGSTPAIDAATLRRLTTLHREDEAALHAILAVIGVQWRLLRSVTMWQVELSRLLPHVLGWLDSANRLPRSNPHAYSLPRRTSAILLDTHGDPLPAAVLRSIGRSPLRPSLRGAAREASGSSYSSVPGSASAEKVFGCARSVLYERIEQEIGAQPPATSRSRLEAVLANWLPAIDVCFDQPSIVDVLVRAPASGNEHRDLQGNVWSKAGATPPGDLTFDDLTNCLAGVITYSASRRALSRDSTVDLVDRMVRATLEAPPDSAPGRL